MIPVRKKGLAIVIDSSSRSQCYTERDNHFLIFMNYKERGGAYSLCPDIEITIRMICLVVYWTCGWVRYVHVVEFEHVSCTERPDNAHFGSSLRRMGG